MTDKRRLSDIENVPHWNFWDYHVIEEINLWCRHQDNEIEHQKFKEDKKTNNEIKNLLSSIWENTQYYSMELDEIESEVLDMWDIIEIKFIKDYKQKELSIVMRFFIRMRYSSSVFWYIYIYDDSTKFESKAREERIALPIQKWWKRKIILTGSLTEALIVSTNQYLHESRIKEIQIFKKWEKKESWIRWIFQSKIWSLLRKK